MPMPDSWSMMMTRTTVCNVLWLCLLACGCQSLPINAAPDPLVDALVEDGQNHLGSPVSTAVIVREIELGTPLMQARSIMERHGFSCWSGMTDPKGTCLQCTAYRRSPHPYIIVVKLFYDSHQKQKEITDVEATVDNDLWRFFVLTEPPACTADPRAWQK
jgi:hypothetical protein